MSFKEKFGQLNPRTELDQIRKRLSNLEQSGGSGGGGEDTIKPGDLTAALYDALESGHRGTIKLEPGAEYHVDETVPVPPKSILEGQGARLYAEANTPLIRPWPTARVRDVMLDWQKKDSFDSIGVHFLHDGDLYDNDIPKPWDERTPGPVRAWAHGRFGSHYRELENVSVAGNRQGKAVSVDCRRSAGSGIHFINGTGINVERTDTAIHLFREAGAIQSNSHTWDVHAEDCRVGVHHEHDPRAEDDKQDPPRETDRAHLNGHQYRMSWQPDGSQNFSETIWHLEEGKNNTMLEWPFFWDLSSRHADDVDPFIFESAYPEMPDYRRNVQNLVVGRHDRSHLFRDEVRDLNEERRRNKSVSWSGLGNAAD